jgi:hypothetical protein
VGESHDAIRAFGLYIKHFECIGWTQPMEVSFAAHPPNMYFPGMDGDLPWTHDVFVKRWLFWHIKLRLYPRNKQKTIFTIEISTITFRVLLGFDVVIVLCI